MLERLRAAFSEPEIVELVAAISLWNALARFHRVMGFELDMDAPPDEVAALL
jgi:alkylhydroperoxidase family enzyme